jgi:hypothetical protein
MFMATGPPLGVGVVPSPACTHKKSRCSSWHSHPSCLRCSAHTALRLLLGEGIAHREAHASGEESACGRGCWHPVVVVGAPVPVHQALCEWVWGYGVRSPHLRCMHSRVELWAWSSISVACWCNCVDTKLVLVSTCIIKTLYHKRAH